MLNNRALAAWVSRSCPKWSMRPKARSLRGRPSAEARRRSAPRQMDRTDVGPVAVPSWHLCDESADAAGPALRR